MTTRGPRPGRLVLVAGTGTEVGKTWVAAALLRHLRQAGFSVAARKPAQSFDPDMPEPTDADVLGEAAGAPPSTVCPPHRWYEIPMAPPMAAAALGRPAPTMAELVRELEWPRPEVDVGVLEPAGGTRSPLAIDGDTVELARLVQPDAVLLVAEPGLGTINLVRMSRDSLPGPRALVVLNRFDPADELHEANRDWLERHDGIAVATDIGTAARFALDGRLPPRSVR